MKSLWIVCVVALLLMVSAFPAGGPKAAAAPASAASADMLKQLEREFMHAAADKGSAGYMSYYAEDAVELPNGEAMIHGKAEIAKTMGFLDSKENRLTWTPIGADMSSSDDLGYTYGTYEFRSTGKDGKVRVEYGKYTSIWKKQADGSWKVALDMGNATPRPQT